MLSQIEGELSSVTSGVAELTVGPLVYALLIPAMDEQALIASRGKTLRFYTFHYLEGQGQGTSFIPRLIGFRSPEARAFFELFTTVKGLGNRKALRSLALPIHAVAGAIAAKDFDLLKSLPEIGKRTAETIVAELHGKVDRFVEMKPDGPSLPDDPRTGLVRDAVAVLTQLGEAHLSARSLIERALTADPSIESPEDLVAAAYRLKE